MRLVFISTINTQDFGGSENLWSDAAFCALENEYEILVVTFKWKTLPPFMEKLKSKGAKLLFRENQALKEDSILQKVYCFSRAKLFNPSVLNAIRQFSPDKVIVSQGLGFDLVYNPLLANFLISSNLPYYIIVQYNDEHKSYSDSFRISAKKVFGNAASIFYVSERNKIVAERQLAMHLNQAEVIQNPFKLKNPRVLPKVGTHKLKMAVVARLETSHKGQDLLIHALSRPNWKNRNWELNLFGQGSDHAYLKELIEFYDLSDKVFLRGYENEIEKIWAEHHCLVLPSHGEGKPLALYEAMLLGRFGVVTDVAGNGELVKDGKTGFLIKAPTVNLIDLALEKTWDARSEWDDLGNNAYQFALNHYDPNAGKTLLNKILC